MFTPFLSETHIALAHRSQVGLGCPTQLPGRFPRALEQTLLACRRRRRGLRLGKRGPHDTVCHIRRVCFAVRFFGMFLIPHLHRRLRTSTRHPTTSPPWWVHSTTLSLTPAQRWPALPSACVSTALIVSSSFSSRFRIWEANTRDPIIRPIGPANSSG